MKNIKIFFAAVFSLIFAHCLNAWDIRILNPQAPYGDTNVFDSTQFSTFRNYLIDTQSSLSQGSLNSYQFDSNAVIINLVNSGAEYTQDERNIISSLLNSSTRVLIFSENSSWSNSRIQLAEILGVTYVSGDGAGNQTGYSDLFPEIMEGVSNFYSVAPGTMTPENGKGISLTSGNSITLWGDNDNFLLLMDVMALTNRDITHADNDQLAQNIAAWLAGSSPIIPELSSYSLILGMASLGLVVIRKRKK